MENEYRRQKDDLALAHALAKRRYERALDEYDEFLASNAERKLLKLPYERHILSLRKDKYEKLEGQMTYMRPSNEEDIAYRERQSKEFADWVSELVPEGLPLRFHGCPIYEAEQTIARGEILSWQERLGISRAEDHVQIPAADKDHIHIGVLEAADIHRHTLPAGCIFVLTPEDSRDEAMGKFHEMDPVDFCNSPDRLVAVITTPENKSRLSSWLRQANISPEKGMTFDDFTQNIRQVINSVSIPYQNRFPKAPLRETMGKLCATPSLDSLLKSATARAAENHAHDRTTLEPHAHRGR